MTVNKLMFFFGLTVIALNFPSMKEGIILLMLGCIYNTIFKEK